MKIACPGCGGNLKFIVGETAKWHCEQCGNEFVEEELELRSIPFSLDEEYLCSSCGAKVIANDNLGITDCIYCGSRQVVKQRINNQYRVDKIIPFKVKKEDAIKAYKEFSVKTKTVPKKFLKSVKFEDIKGVYVPCCLYEFGVGISETMLDKSVKTSCYFQEEILKVKIIQDTGLNFKDNIMKKIEPFYFSSAIKFNPYYLGDFFVENADDEIENLEKKAETQGVTKIIEYVVSKNKGKKGEIIIELKESQKEVILLPVWFFNVKYRNKLYPFIVNGQTNRIMGIVPNSFFKSIYNIIKNKFFNILNNLFESLKIIKKEIKIILLLTAPVLILLLQGLSIFKDMLEVYYIFVFVISIIYINLITKVLKTKKSDYSNIKNDNIKVIKSDRRKLCISVYESVMQRKPSILRCVFRNNDLIIYLNDLDNINKL